MGYFNLSEKYMLDRNEDVLLYSEAEYLRRRSAVIAEMKKRGLELLIISNPCEEAYGAWLANDTSCSYILLDAHGELTVVYGYGTGDDSGREIAPGTTVNRREIHRLIPGVRYVSGVDVGYILNRIPRDGSIGVINRPTLGRRLWEKLSSARNDLNWVDMRIPVGLLRAVRSAEEQAAIHGTAQLHEKLFAAAPVFIREGRYVREVVRDLTYCACELGGGRDETSIFILEYGLENTNKPMPSRSAMMEMIKKSDQRIAPGFRLLVMVEMSRHYGMVLDTGRNYSVGEPHPAVKRVADMTVKAQEYTASLMRPGAIPSEIEEKAKKYAGELGINMLTWNLLHGLGNTRTELPDLRDPTTRDIPLLENMFLLCEPNTCIPYGSEASPSYDAENVLVIPNTYLVTGEGGVRTVNYPSGITVL